MEQWALEVLSAYGLAGLVIFVLAVAVLAQRKEIRSLNTKLVECAGKGAAEAEQLKKVIEGIIPVTEARNRTTESLVGAFNTFNVKFEAAVNEGRLQRDSINQQITGLRGDIANVVQGFQSLERLVLRRRT